jgi:hypothetical protein
VPIVLKDQQWRIEKCLLRLCLRHMMLYDAFALIAGVPIETDDLRPIDH